MLHSHRLVCRLIDNLDVDDLDSGDILETGTQEWLDCTRVLCVGQDLEKFLVGEEEEPREGNTLRFQVIGEAFLDFF